MLQRLGIETTFIQGLRQTTEAVLDVAEMVLAGSINKQIVRRILQGGAHALGLSGTDDQLIQAEPVANSAELGFVGEITGVNAELIKHLLDLQLIPVIAPIGIDAAGQRYNINADTAAGAVASHLGVRSLVMITDVPGIMKTVDGVQQVLPVVSTSEITTMIQTGVIYGGMIPKVQAAMHCLYGSVTEVLIASGTEPGVLRKATYGEGIGTRIVRG
jgi:acetylglutamate kinase